METVFNVLTHILVIIGIISIFYFIGYMIHKTEYPLEKMVRAAAFSTGLLIYIGSHALGLSIPSLMMSAVSTTNPFTMGVLGIILPSLIGTFVAWYILRNINKDENLASRLIILITTFIAVLFGDVYAKTFGPKTELYGYNVHLLPNLVFTISLSLYVILKLKNVEKLGKKRKIFGKQSDKAEV